MKPHVTFSLLLGAALLSFGSAGCADQITFSKDSERRGDELYKSGQYADAAGAYRNAARQSPNDYLAYYMMGQCYEQTGQHQQAVSAYRTSMQVQAMTVAGKHDEPQRILTITGLAQAIAKSDSRDTETNDAVAKARGSQNPLDYLLLAKIHQFRGDADSAMEAYEHATLLAPDNFLVAKESGLYFEQLGQATKAEPTLRRAYALNGTDQQVNLALRRLGVVPGPSLKNERDLVPPPVPKGPIPPFNVTKFRFEDQKSAPANQQPTTPPPTAQAPRD